MRINLLAVLALACPLNSGALHAQELPEGLSTSDWNSIRAAYEAGRRKVMAVHGAHEARTHGQEWLLKFDGRGVSVQPDAGEWTWGLELTAYGFAGAERAVATPQSVKAEGQRLTYGFGDTLDEWYVNASAGLEHGYTLRERPAGEGTLTFHLRVRGDLTPKIENSGRDVAFQLGAETRLAYTGLRVFDASGRVLPARFSVQSEGLLLSIDERGACYPVTVDPIVQHAYLKASNSYRLDSFGHSVAVSGNTVVVGASGEDSIATGVNGNQLDNSASEAGAAYIFVRNGSTWIQQAYLKASNTGEGDRFGSSVAVSGDTVVVGAYGEGNSPGYSGAGAAYVFVRHGATWSQQAFLKASNAQSGDRFGTAVAVSGDTIVVGADGEASNATGINGNQANNAAIGAGAAYIFERAGSSWSQQAYLKGSNTEEGDNFGTSVAVCGRTVVVGAPDEASNATGVNGAEGNNLVYRSGAAYVFIFGRTSWLQQAYLKASNTGQYDYFGFSVAVSGDTIVVGAYGEDSNATGINGNQLDNSATTAGAAYVFVRNVNSWAQQAYLKASNTDAGDRFGSSVALSGDVIVAGAHKEASNATGVNDGQSANSAAAAGAAYVFARHVTAWSQQAYLKASNTDAGDSFGWSVAVSGDTVVVGAWEERSRAFSTGSNLAGSPFDNSYVQAGAAYVYDLRSGSVGSLPRIQQQAYVKPFNTDSDDYFGGSVAVSGDTVVVGAAFEASNANGVNGDQTDNSTNRAGAAYVFVRNGTSWSQQAYLKASNSNSYDYFGYSVSLSGDTIVVGAYGEDSGSVGVNSSQANNSATRAGAAYVFTRSGNTWGQQAYLKASNTDALDLFGWSVAVSGDTIVVGARGEASSAIGVNSNWYDDSVPHAGAAYVFVRNGTAWSQQAYLKASNTDAGDEFGFSISISGDTVVVGAFGEASSTNVVNGNQFNNTTAASGAAYVFQRTGVAWSQQAYLKASNTNVDDYFGSSVSISGDTIAVGAYGEDSNARWINGNQLDNSSSETGAAYVFVRSGTIWNQQAYLKASNSNAGDLFGYSVSVSGDTIVAGAYEEDSNATGPNGNQANNGAAISGAAYVFRKCGSEWAQSTYLKASNSAAGDYFGIAVAASDDLLVVGAIGESSSAIGVNGNQANNSASFSGAAYVFTNSQLRPTLWALNAPRLGQSYTLAIDNLEPTSSLAILVFGGTQFPLPGTNLGFLGMPCGDLYQSMDLFLPLAPGAGGSATWTVPVLSGVPGSTVYCQALCLDPLANTLGLTISNQLTITLVP